MSDWAQYATAEGQAYFYNSATGETSWEAPAELTASAQAVESAAPTAVASESSAADSSWGEYFDGDGNKYYYNTVTAETSWDPPPGFKREPIEAAEPTSVATAASQQPEAATSTEADDWSTELYAETGQYYYFNKRTGLTQWEMPECLKPVEATPQTEPQTNSSNLWGAKLKSTTTKASAGQTETAARKRSINVKTNTPSTENAAMPAVTPRQTLRKGSVRSSISSPLLPVATDGNNTTASSAKDVSSTSEASISGKTTPGKLAPTPTIASTQSPLTSVRKSISRSSVSVLSDDAAALPQSSTPSAGSTASSVPAGGSKDASSKSFRPLMGVGKPDDLRNSAPATEESKSSGSDSDDARVVSSLLQEIDKYSNVDDPATHAELVKRVDGLSLEQFAEANFNFERRGLFQNKSAAEKLLAWRPELLKVSLCTLDQELNEEAVECFRHVTGFMGDRKTRKDQVEHAMSLIATVLSCPPALHTEVICQICKQLKGNPSSESRDRGWHLLLLMLASVPVAANLLPYFIAFLISWEQTNSKCAPLAKLALKASIRGCKLPARRELPMQMEIDSLRSADASTASPVIVRVYFVDNKHTMMRVDSWTTVQELHSLVARKLDLPVHVHSAFGLFQTFGPDDSRPLDTTDRILDILASWQRQNTQVYDLKFVFMMKYYFDVLGMMGSSTGSASTGSTKAFKDPTKGAANTAALGAANINAATFLPVLDMLFIQCVSDVLSSHYPCSVNDYLFLAALRLHDMYGDYPLSAVHAAFSGEDSHHGHLGHHGGHHRTHSSGTNSGSSVSIETANPDELDVIMRLCMRDATIADLLPTDLTAVFVPETLVEPRATMTHDKTARAHSNNPLRVSCARRIVALYEKCIGMTKVEARVGYISYVKSWKLYGSAYFIAESSSDADNTRMYANYPAEVILAVTPTALVVVDPHTRVAVDQFNFVDVASWGHSYNSFVLVHSGNSSSASKLAQSTGSTNGTEQKKYFKTEHGKDINEYVTAYVKVLRANSKSNPTSSNMLSSAGQFGSSDDHDTALQIMSHRSE
jgi:hypothetical protein